MNGNGAVYELLYRLNVGSHIDSELLREAFDKTLSCSSNGARDVQLGQILTGIMAKGPTVDEVVTLLESALKVDDFLSYRKQKVDLPRGERLVSAIGSGKKGFKTMNISTPALLVAASAGAYTAKSVSRSTSSLTGSSDLVNLLGINVDLPVDDMARTIQTTGFGVFTIERLIPKFDSVYGGKFYAPQALSFGLAALVSPVEYDSMLYGLAHPNVELSLEVLRRFGVDNAMIASTTHDNVHYLDEMGVYGTTRLIGVRNGVVGSLVQFRPTEELGLPRYTPNDIVEGYDASQNAQFVVDVLRGRGERAREDVICINAGTVLYLAGKAGGLSDGYALAKSTVKSGRPIMKLREVIEATGGNAAALERYL